jgi:phosphatidylglycerol lysyltransferase
MHGKKFLRNISPLFGVLLFAAALWVLHYELKEYHYHDVLRQLKALPTQRLLLALLFTALGYLVLIGYDFLALRYVNHPLGYGKIAAAGFIGYAFSNNIGVSMLAAIRYRLYSSWGLSSVDITKVVAFCGLAFWSGIFTVGGILFLIEPFEIPPVIHYRFVSLPYLGILFLVLIAGYLLFSALKKKPLKIFRWEFSIPSLKFSLFSIVIASLDVMLNGSVLYVLLPSHENLSYPKTIGIFVLSQIVGLVSQVPGGLGIIETVIIFFLSPILPISSILGSLLAFRGIYYLLPMCFATVLLGIHEFFQRKEAFRLIARIFGQWVSEIVPDILSFTTFLGGAILLFSGSIPAEKIRMMWIKDIIPLPIMEISHFFGSLAGILLLNAAYPLAAAVLIAGIVFSLLKGFDYEEAIILAIMLGALLPSRRHFYRKTSLINEPFTPGWIAAITFVILCSVWLGLFVYKHVEYSDELWWYFSLSGDAPRYLRATVGVGVLAISFAVFKLLRPASKKLPISFKTDLDTIRSIVNSSRHTYANLALLGDKSFLLSEHRNAFIMYAVYNRCWVAMRDPVGPETEMSELIWKYHEMCDRHDGWTVFYEVDRRNLHIYIDLGLTLMKLGEEARVLLPNFSLEGKVRKELRSTCNRLEKKGCIFELIPTDEVPSLLHEFKIISDTWMAKKNITEKGFCTGFFDAEYLKNFPAGIVRINGKIIAFVNIWQGAGKEEISLDLMRYLPDAPNGVMEYLFIQLMLWGKQKGYKWFNLGMAPLSGLENHALAPLWSRLGALVFSHGEHFYNFQGLRRYKEKFYPEWEPKYLASPGGLKLPRILTSIALLISRGFKKKLL